MLTPWGEQFNPDAPLPEYPRPQMVRDSYYNLNGPWQYAVTQDAQRPMKADGTIIVPYSPECQLSGVERRIRPGDWLWYIRDFTLPEDFFRGRVLLHFGAVDQLCSVWLNGVEAGSHSGGYSPFTVDLTELLKKGSNTLMVCVRDLTDRNELPRGKQRLEGTGIWYPGQSGIWQTVWLESVPKNYIRGLKITPRPEDGLLELVVYGQGKCVAGILGKKYAFPAGSTVRVPVPECELWTPEHPKLYYFSVTLDGVDRVKSYFAMRSIAVGPDEAGVPRLLLNGEPYFHNGLLDQGYWSDGQYTPPADEAMIFDIMTAKDMGFNMLRKHMKVEPDRWYYHCDRLGMLVWQDMPAGGGEYSPAVITAPLVTKRHIDDSRYRLFGRESAEGRANFLMELKRMVSHLYNHPCIVLGVPFNEGWGQFDSQTAIETIHSIDRTRVIDHASGWHDQGIGETQSLHVYFTPYRFKPDKKGRAVLLSEFGGYTLKIAEHSRPERPFGYKPCGDEKALEKALCKLYYKQIHPAVEKGLAAAVYTQLSDVETEMNGLMTYDRHVVKLSPDVLRPIITGLGEAPEELEEEEYEEDLPEEP